VSSPSTGPANPFTTGALSALPPSGAPSDQPPPFLVPIYKAAAQRYQVPWRILAAINSVETDYGRNLNVSSAGAIGWMQFMPATWQQYGVAADGHGRPDPYNPRDAIFSAARYLAANGAGQDLRGAIFAYNHANWYVDMVLRKAQAIIDYPGWSQTTNGYTLPLERRYMQPLGRTDDGLDIENAPDGAPVYSMTAGVVTAVASDPAGFGPNYPVIEATNGPLTGKYIYYGHVATSLVHPGDHIKTGQPIAIMGHTGDAVSLGHGHIEIGFSTAGGDPLNHHGAEAWTPAGDQMRQLLVSLLSAPDRTATPARALVAHKPHSCGVECQPRHTHRFFVQLLPSHIWFLTFAVDDAVHQAMRVAGLMV
jgi:murein DD-endopeptidase MepM/ murein hydrolase activator NlpD